ncbi:MAG: pyridoxal phosphate-dependent aminotransferase [Aggregatilineales bacterium]
MNMTIPEALSRPLSSRLADLPEVVERDDNPDIPQAVIDSAVKALADGKTHYTDRPGILPLRQWVSDNLARRHNVDVPPDGITITCGRTEARFVAIKFLATPGSVIYCPGDPTGILGAAQLAGATLTDEPDDADAIKLAYLTPHDGKAKMEQALELIGMNNGYLIWDMVYGREDFHPAQHAELAGKVVTLGALSYRLPGWRIGWLAGSDKAGKLRAYKQSLTICATSISQWAALGLVESL